MNLAVFRRWESMLALVLVLEFVLFSALSPYFLDVDPRERSSRGTPTIPTSLDGLRSSMSMRALGA